MADRIVQLKDNQGNNVYPVAGSMKQGSITTNMLNDGIVTEAKLANNSIVSTSQITVTYYGGINTAGNSTTRNANLITLKGGLKILCVPQTDTGIYASDAGKNTQIVCNIGNADFSTILSGTINMSQSGAGNVSMAYSAIDTTYSFEAYLYPTNVISGSQLQVRAIIIGT